VGQERALASGDISIESAVRDVGIQIQRWRAEMEKWSVGVLEVQGLCPDIHTFFEKSH
jgi:hypothetical protein